MSAQHRSAADDTVIRLALAMLVADVRARITPRQRQWILDRLQDATTPFSEVERGKLQGPLLVYIAQYHPRIREIVARQFDQETEAHAATEEKRTRRPAVHYGTVPGRNNN